MADYTYDPGLVVDDATGQAVPNATGELRATPSGSAVAVYDLLGNPLPNLSTNAKGVVQRFSADIARGYIYFGSVPQAVASDQAQDAVAEAAAAQTAAEAAQTQATTAAGQAATSASAASAAQAAAVAAQAAAQAITVPTTAADVGAFPANIRRWNGSSWSSRPVVPSGYSVESYSDGSYGSTYDAAATAPPSSVEGDGWTKA